LNMTLTYILHIRAVASLAQSNPHI
jgi:hypothetical protein